jgi:hypothetical protein
MMEKKGIIRLKNVIYLPGQQRKFDFWHLLTQISISRIFSAILEFKK